MKAVNAESCERIHRSNLVCMGVLQSTSCLILQTVMALEPVLLFVLRIGWQFGSDRLVPGAAAMRVGEELVLGHAARVHIKRSPQLLRG